jgi:undecaprenyl-diphosphatase
MMIGATVPVVACGIAFHHAVETYLRSLYVISAAMIVLALVLVGAELLVRYRHRRGVPDKTLENFGWEGAIWVGLAQAVALIPGASRSGVTITGGLFVGLSRSEAARFSFLLSLLSVFAAGVHQLYKEKEALLGSQENAVNLIVATVVSGLVGYPAMWFLMTYLKKHTLYLFVGYRIVLGLVLLALLATGVLTP